MTSLKPPVIFRVSAQGQARKIASAMVHALLDDQHIVLRAVGPNATAKAVKSAAIATEFLPAGVRAVCTVSFANVGFADVDASALELLVWLDRAPE